MAQFTSGGSRLVPEFICESRERLDAVCEFFENFHPNPVEVTFKEEIFPYPREEYLQECKKISQKGLYCFDISDEPGTAGGYLLICKPAYGLWISDLPETIQSILVNYKIPDVNFANNEMIPLRSS